MTHLCLLPGFSHFFHNHVSIFQIFHTPLMPSYQIISIHVSHFLIVFAFSSILKPSQLSLHPYCFPSTITASFYFPAPSLAWCLWQLHRCCSQCHLQLGRHTCEGTSPCVGWRMWIGMELGECVHRRANICNNIVSSSIIMPLTLGLQVTCIIYCFQPMTCITHCFQYTRGNTYGTSVLHVTYFFQRVTATTSPGESLMRCSSVQGGWQHTPSPLVHGNHHPE